MNILAPATMFIVMSLLTAGLIVEHSRLSIIPFIIAIISGIVVIQKVYCKHNKDKYSKDNENKYKDMDEDISSIFKR